MTQTQGRGLDRLSPRVSLTTTWVDTSVVADIDSSKRVDRLLKGAGCTQRSLVLKSVVVRGDCPSLWYMLKEILNLS